MSSLGIEPDNWFYKKNRWKPAILSHGLENAGTNKLKKN